MTIDERPLADAPSVPLLDEHPHRMGPVTRWLILRTASIIALVEIIGTVLTFATHSTASRALGVGMIFPGAGFLFSGTPVLFVVAVALAAVSFVLWWGISALWGLPAVWAISAIGAMALAGGTEWHWAVPVAYALAVASLGSAAWSFEHRFRTKRAKIADLNQYLSTTRVPEPSREWQPVDETDAELLRWCYELALQPLDQFDGFEWGDQFHGGTCVRYQLNYLGWALAEYAVNHLPNAPTEIELVLRNLMLKQTDLRVWAYWRTLNLIGNFDANPDPLVKDNIMFSGFTGDQLNMYEAATGSTYFDQPGSLTFVWKDGRTFAYDHHSWMEAVRRNFDAGRSVFFPCEPGWAFAACNTIGAQALLGYDVLHGATLWSELEPRWRATLDEEYALPDGNFANIRCTRTGLSWDTGETPGGEYLVTGSNGFADVAPDLSLRGRAIATRGLGKKVAGLHGLVRDGELQLEMPLEWERNRARQTAVNGWTKLIAGARMAGDTAMVAAARRAAGVQCRTGERWPERPLNAGVQNMATHMIVRWAAPMDTAMLNLRGYVPPVGPVLGPVPWPQAQVTSARSLDGVSLDLEIRPIEGALTDRLTLTFRQLRPHTDYLVAGRTMVADGEGCASLELTIAEGAHLRVEPGGAA